MAKIVQLIRHGDGKQIYPRTTTDQIAVIMPNKEDKEDKQYEDK